MRRFVTEREVEEAFFHTPVAQLIEQGLGRQYTVVEIAQKLGPSPRSIYRWANKYGVSLPRNPGRKPKQVQ